MKGILLAGICLFLLFSLKAQEETAEFVFHWADNAPALATSSSSFTPNAEGAYFSFWEAGINCRAKEEPGGSTLAKGAKVHLKQKTHTRFDHTYSVELYTDASILESCNQNRSAVRAEVITRDELVARLSAGSIFPAQAGTTIWLGWSELYTDFDFSHKSTLLQFLQEEFANSVSSSINYHPEKGIYLGVGKAYHSLLDRSELKENVWYDWIVEFRYSFHDTGPEAGLVRIWVYPADDPDRYTYTDLPKVSYTGATLPSSPSSPFKTKEFPRDSLFLAIQPQLRMGIYRWESGSKKPEDMATDDQRFIKFLGPTRMEIGEDLGELGFEAVKPRPPYRSDGFSFARASEAVLDSLSGSQVFLHPNPLSGSSTLRILHAEEGPGELKIWDMTGRLLRHEVIELQPGSTELLIEKGRLAAGSYILQISLGEELSTLRFVIK